MMPQLQTVLLNWTSAVQMKVIQKKAVDFELEEDVVAVPGIEMMITPMSPQKIARKPENERTWKFWEGWSTVRIELDAVIQDPDGLQFRVQSVHDWSQAGFFEYELVQQPYGLGEHP